MLANPEIPVRMTNPSDVEVILKPKLQIQIGPLTQLIENDPIVNSFDTNFAPVVSVE
jgi:hypothetical protein